MDPNEPQALLAEIRRTGMTQSSVAKAIGVYQSSVSKLERGDTKGMHSKAFRGLLELHQRVVKRARKSRPLSQISTKQIEKTPRENASGVHCKSPD